MKKLCYAIFMLVLIASCKKDYDKIDKERIEDYLKSKSLTAKITSDGVHYIVDVEGKGDIVKDNDEVTLKIKGYTLDDKEFAKSDSVTFLMNELIPGFSSGTKQFKVGGSGKIFIPSSLAFGTEGVPGLIAGNEPLVYDIKVLGLGLRRKANNKDLKAYAAKKNWKLDSLPSGLFYVIETPGTGDNPTVSSRVTVTYKGYTTDDKIFDGSTSTFPLANVIKGWQEGIPLFKKGGKGRLLIPYHLAYGSQGSPPNIGSFKPLIFDVELIGF